MNNERPEHQNHHMSYLFNQRCQKNRLVQQIQHVPGILGHRSQEVGSDSRFIMLHDYWVTDVRRWAQMAKLSCFMLIGPHMIENKHGCLMRHDSCLWSQTK